MPATTARARTASAEMPREFHELAEAMGALENYLEVALKLSDELASARSRRLVQVLQQCRTQCDRACDAFRGLRGKYMRRQKQR